MSSLDFNQFREGAMTTFSNRAFQESATRILKLLDRTFNCRLSWVSYGRSVNGNSEEFNFINFI